MQGLVDILRKVVGVAVRMKHAPLSDKNESDKILLMYHEGLRVKDDAALRVEVQQLNQCWQMLGWRAHVMRDLTFDMSGSRRQGAEGPE